MKTNKLSTHKFDSFEKAVAFFNEKLLEGSGVYTYEKDDKIARFSPETGMIQLGDVVYFITNISSSKEAIEWVLKQLIRCESAGYSMLEQTSIVKLYSGELCSDTKSAPNTFGSISNETTIVVNGRVLDSSKEVCKVCQRWSECSFDKYRERCDVLS